MRRALTGIAGAVLLLLTTMAVAAWGATVDHPLVNATSSLGSSPFGAQGSCDPGSAGRGSVNYPNTKVEPYIAVNPTNNDNLVGVWQQDRWNDGGARGLLSAYSTDGGDTWAIPSVVDQADFSLCTGGTAANGGDYTRATDPWVTFDGHGNAWQISDSLTFTDFVGHLGPTAIIVSKSSPVDGVAGASWGSNQVLHADTDPNFLNDKESITADPHHADNVYAVWDRLEIPRQQASTTAGDNAIGYHGPTLFSRTTDGGASWSPAEVILDPGAVNQTLGNEINVLGDDSAIVNGFDLIFNFKNAGGTRGEWVAVQRSTDHGEHWGPAIRTNRLLSVGVRNSNGELLRTAPDLPDFTTDPRSNSQTMYAVWQDARFTSGQRDQVAFSKSTDGGLTWTAPTRINTHTLTPAFNPDITVGADGTIVVTYYDFRNDSDFDGNAETPSNHDELLTDVWSLTSTDGGAHWAENQVTDRSFDFRSAASARGFFLGDYQGLAFAAGGTNPGFHPFFAVANGTAAETFNPCALPPAQPAPGCETDDNVRGTGDPTNPHSDVFTTRIAP